MKDMGEEEFRTTGNQIVTDQDPPLKLLHEIIQEYSCFEHKYNEEWEEE